MEPLKALVRVQNIVSACSQCFSTSTEEHEPEDELSRVFFRTKYDIHVELNADATRVLEIFLQPQHAQTAAVPQATTDTLSTGHMEMSYKSNTLTPPLASPDVESKFRYRIFPDWQTSYLWHDPEWPGSPKDSSDVDLEDIEHRYPQLYTYWDRWVDLCETEFYDKTFRGVSATHDYETFVLIDRDHTVAWGVNGFLMACWLLQQPDVDSVIYKPHGIVYDLNAENKEAEFEKFLKDVMA